MIDFDELVEVTDKSINGFQVIRIKKGEFEGIEYIYGSVSFEEIGDTVKLHFVYDLVSGCPADEPKFHKLTGDILVSILDRQLLNSDVVYHNGINE